MAMNSTWNLASLARMRGCSVRTSDGTDIGEIVSIVYEYASENPVWIGISPHHGLPFHTLLAPIDGAIEEEGILQVAFSADEIREEPPADLGEGFDSLTDQRHLYDYFALAFDERTEIRVLRTGQDLP